MHKKTLLCLNCEVEFTVRSEADLPVGFCPFCGAELDDDDGYEEEDD